MNRRTGIVLVAGLALAATLAVTPPHRIAEAATPVITVSRQPYRTADGVRVSPIPAEIVGANHRWPDDGKGMWDPAADAPVGGIDALARSTGLKSVRYPGGTVANLFDFSRAIGPQSDRGCQTSGGFANGLFQPTDSRFGPDEQQQFVAGIGARTMIMVPSINRTAADAADYVEYMNAAADGTASNPGGGVDWAERRAENGHPEPYAIRVWEYGNEPYLPNQRYWRSQDSATKVQQFLHGGWQRQTADSEPYADNDGLFTGCDLATRQQGTGEPDQSYRVRYPPIALPGDEHGTSGVGEAPVSEPVLTVDDENWRRVDDLKDAGADDRVYTVSRQTGEVTFGDGRHGAVPPDGARLSIEYDSGVHGGFLDFRDAMKEIDPGIEVCAGWGKPEFIDAIGAEPYDCLGVHSYTTPPDDGTPLRYHNLQYGAGSKSRDLADYRRRFAGHFPDPADRPELIVTEYGHLNVPIADYGATLAHNLYLADLVAGQLENDVRISINSNLNNLGSPDRQRYGELFGYSPDFIDTGRARMLSLYARMAGDSTVRSTVSGNPVLTSDLGDYPGLRVVASRSASTTRLMVINRDPDRQIRSQVVLPDRAAGRVRISTLTGADISVINTREEPDAIMIRSSVRDAARSRWTETFPSHSVTLIEFTR